jgi:dephospho-CoA kinase
MNRPLEVGITGGIGSGKSVVCRIFQCLGIPVYDADSRAKKLMTTDGILVEQIKKEFGTLSYYPDGSLNRAHLSQTVFGNPERLNTLNGMVHPRVGLDYDAWVQKYKESPFVYAPAHIRMKRVLARDPQRTEQEVKNIMNNQWADDYKMNRANAVVYNDEQHLVIPQILSLHHQFLTAH